MGNLTKTLAVVSLLIPASAYPLGIGDIKLHSSLNQNLNAEISLVLSPGENISDLKVHMAPSDKFSEAGVPWVNFLSKIKFQTISRSANSAVIKLTSRDAVKEPFLDLLIEVTWPKGNLYREFTVLLDPPSVYEQATIPVSPFVPSDEPSYGSEQDFVAQAQRQPLPRSQARPQRNIARENGQTVTGRNDTLWSIAERAARGTGVSIEQMMIAIYEQNQDAFYKKNVNALMAGKSLKIPERNVIVKLSRKEALAEFNRQTSEWKNRLTPAPVESATVKTASTATEATDNQLTLVAPTEEGVPEGVAVKPGNEQVTAEQKAATSAEKTGVQNQESAGEKPANAATPVDDALQSRVAALEKQLAMMQELINLKDQQLANLQNQPKSAPQEKTSAEEAAVTKPAVQPVPAQEQAVVKPTPPPVIVPKPEPVDDSLSPYYIAGGVGTGLFILLGWFWWRKNKLQAETSESLFAPNAFGTAKTNDIFAEPITTNKTGYDDGDMALGENLFLSDFTANDFEAFDLDQGEIDPISEADVYLAYGRYQQAEHLMRDAIKDQPGQDEYKLKLLEIFYSNENAQAFESYATELADAGKKDNTSFWAKVTEMGSEICPNSVLFVSGGSSGYKFEPQNIPTTENKNVTESKNIDLTKTAESKTEEAADDLDFNLASFEELFSSKPDEAAKPKDDFFDFDLSSFEDTVTDKDNDSKADDTIESIEFDLSLFADEKDNKPEEKAAEVVQKPAVEVKDEIESFDFDFNLDDEPVVETEEAATSIAEDTIEVTPATIQSTDKPSALNNSGEQDAFVDDLDFDFDFDAPIPRKNQGTGQESNFGVTDLSEMDEMETKLDLAIAYIDMSDIDAAREIATEVLKKGNPEQQMIAQALLDGL